jgi:hypothetical protein
MHAAQNEMHSFLPSHSPHYLSCLIFLCSNAFMCVFLCMNTHSHRYLSRLLEWSRQLNMSVMIDLHAAPGSQNGCDHSGRRGDIRWNESRTLRALRKLLDFVRVNDWQDVVYGVGLVNEPWYTIPNERVESFYRNASKLFVDTDTAHHSPAIVMQDHFNLREWDHFQLQSSKISAKIFVDTFVFSILYTCYSCRIRSYYISLHSYPLVRLNL